MLAHYCAIAQSAPHGSGGNEVTAIDFSPVAVDQAKHALGSLEDKIVLGDFFDYDFGTRPFDLVYERTSLCSLPPSVWEDYVRRVAQLLRVGGKRTGLVFYGNEPEPPPYPLSDKRAADLFDKQFQLVRNEAVSESVPMFAGAERWQEWSRRDEASQTRQHALENLGKMSVIHISTDFLAHD